MKARRTLIALPVGGAAAAVAAGMSWLSVRNGTFEETGSAFVALAVAYAVVGAFLIARTWHPIGWLFCVIAISFPLGILMEEWVTYAARTCEGCLPVLDVFFVTQQMAPMIGAAAIVHVFLLFPSGKLPPRHGRTISRAYIAFLSVILITLLVRPAADGAPMPNPYAVETLRIPGLVLFGIALVGALACAVFAIVGLVARYRRSGGLERAQMRWLTLVGRASALLFVINFPIQAIFGSESAVAEGSWTMFFLTLMIGIPVAVGFAILRYRLYDIDRIISRTLSYAVITAILVGFYALIAVVIPSVALGTEDTPDAVIALGTLAAAAAFGPVRRWVQTRVDKRFNRARYDAVQTIEGFTAHLREQVDLDSVVVELESIADRTMRPAHLFVWMRP